jgi:hypothetical protein
MADKTTAADILETVRGMTAAQLNTAANLVVGADTASRIMRTFCLTAARIKSGA